MAYNMAPRRVESARRERRRGRMTLGGEEDVEAGVADCMPQGQNYGNPIQQIVYVGGLSRNDSERKDVKIVRGSLASGLVDNGL